MDTFTTYDHETGESTTYPACNGFVHRCVSPIHDVNRPDARRVAEILNEFFEREPKGLDRIDARLGYRIQVAATVVAMILVLPFLAALPTVCLVMT